MVIRHVRPRAAICDACQGSEVRTDDRPSCFACGRHCCLGSFSAFAADWKAFTPAAFSAAQAEGKSILVDISAPWCPTCRAQKPILEELTAAPEYKDLVVLKVDFDSQADDVRALKAQLQSTLIAFKGPSETARSVGDTNKSSIAALLKSSL